MALEDVHLTPRQKEVVELVAAGHTYEQVGAKLGISPRTVRHYVNDVAAQIPGEGDPKVRSIIWFLTVHAP